MAAPLFSQNTIRYFRDMTEGMMGSEAVVTTLGSWVDTGGGSGYFAPGSAVSFKCRLRPMDNNTDILESLTAGRLDVTNNQMMFYPLAIDELTSDTALTVDGEDYQVIGTPPIGTYSAHRVAIVTKRKAGPV